MDKQGNEVFLTEQESQASGYPSPINLITFDAAQEHESSLRELRRLEAMQAADDDELTVSERAMIAPSYARCVARLTVTTELIAAQGLESHEAELIDGIENYLGRE